MSNETKELEVKPLLLSVPPAEESSQVLGAEELLKKLITAGIIPASEAEAAKEYLNDPTKKARKPKKGSIVPLQSITNESKVAFKDLPKIFTPGKLVSYFEPSSGGTVDGTTVTAKIEGELQYNSWNGFRWYVAQLKVAFAGYKHLHTSYTMIVIKDFEPGTQIKTLPLNLLDTAGDLYKKAVVRGKTAIDFVKTKYLQYSGNVISQKDGDWWARPYGATGRIMVDLDTMRFINPRYNSYYVNVNRNNNPHQDEMDIHYIEHPTDEDFAICLPFLYGFSFRSKLWGQFLIDDIANIEFKDKAYESLILDSTNKEMLLSLVDSNTEGQDIVAGKGGGLIFLLSGTPGVGKTLTVETVAEKLHRPIYMVSVGELGTTPEVLEHKLEQILTLCSTWKAVLLIDEADIFLEARNLEINRNAMVGIFLRLLEYYNGILFLTTNRSKNIDEAFYSRINLALHYSDLEAVGRKEIWTKQLSLYGLTLSDTELIKLSETVINGRQIKNCVRILHALHEKNNYSDLFVELEKVVAKIISFKSEENK